MTRTAAHRRDTAAISLPHRGGTRPFATRSYVTTAAILRDIPDFYRGYAGARTRAKRVEMQWAPSRRIAAVALDEEGAG